MQKYIYKSAISENGVKSHYNKSNILQIFKLKKYLKIIL